MMVAVEVKKLATVPNAVDVVIQNETHTAASVIVERLLQTEGCEYAAYKVEHPMDDFVTIRIQAADGEDPMRLFKSAVWSIVKDVDDLLVQTKKTLK